MSTNRIGRSSQVGGDAEGYLSSVLSRLCTDDFCIRALISFRIHHPSAVTAGTHAKEASKSRSPRKVMGRTQEEMMGVIG